MMLAGRDFPPGFRPVPAFTPAPAAAPATTQAVPMCTGTDQGVAPSVTESAQPTPAATISTTTPSVAAGIDPTMGEEGRIARVEISQPAAHTAGVENGVPPGPELLVGG